MNIQKITNVIYDSLKYVEDKNYYSYDVYDGLNNSFFSTLLKDQSLIRRIIVQLNARTPINIRPILGINKYQHTKAISDLISIYSLLYEDTQDSSNISKAQNLYVLLMDRGKQKEGMAWGLNFPYSTRFINAYANTPNLYNTLNAVNSLLDYYKMYKELDVEKIINEVLKYIFYSLGVCESGEHSAWIRYYPNQKIPNYNVNASSAALFLRINNVLNREIVSPLLIRKILNFLVEHQNNDGSWYYAASENGRWIDGFHSGFILEGLATILATSKEFDIEKCFEIGVKYYIENLFDYDGRPKYYHNKLYPIESQNCAQAIQTLALLNILLGIDTKKLLERVIDNSISYLYNENGYFYHKVGKYINNKVPYFRWSQTPMILSLLYAKKVFQ